MKYVIKDAFICFIFLVVCVAFLGYSSYVYADGRTIARGSVNLYKAEYPEEDDFDEEEYDELDDDDDDYYYDVQYSRVSREKGFSFDKKGYIRVVSVIKPKAIAFEDLDDEEDGTECLVTSDGYIKKGKVTFQLIRNGKVVDSYKYNVAGYDLGEKIECWFSTDKKLEPGQYSLKISGDGKAYVDELNEATTYSVSYRILHYNGYAKKAYVKKKVSKAGGYWVNIGKFGDGLPYFKNIRFSNKKVVGSWWIKNNGAIMVYARTKGKCTVKVKLRNGKKYKTKVNVKPGDPNFMAYVHDYKTRGNCFVVKVKNLGVSKLTIYKTGAKALDKDYKSYDRRIKGGKVVIKPGKTKKIKFYVKGKTTWPNYKHFTIHSRFKYEGKTYKWKTRYDYTWFKRGGKWLNTFWNFAKYEEWE